ncbi:MAG: hypothetical protein ABI351_03675 [Herbaspirillum sp.]
METKINEYRGFQIAVTPIKDHEDLWDFKYQISDENDPASTAVPHHFSREQTLGGYETAETASDAGFEVAKIEVDNRIALSEK